MINLGNIWKYLQDNYPYTLILIVVIAVCWRVFRLYARFEKVEGNCGDMQTDIKSLKVDMKSVQTDVKSLQTDMKSVQTDIKSINVQLNAFSSSFEKLLVFLSLEHKKFQYNAFAGKSPIQLTEFGEKVLIAVGGKRFIDQHAGSLIEAMRQVEFKSPLDIQNYSLTLLFHKIDHDGFTPIKNFIFNNPTFEMGRDRAELTRRLVLNIMSFYFRNKYFEKYPETYA